MPVPLDVLHLALLEACPRGIELEHYGELALEAGDVHFHLGRGRDAGSHQEAIREKNGNELSLV
jgi:hypothetical protein